MQLILTILCSGSGSRLWPVSHELHSKPFFRPAGGHSLMQKAFLRGTQPSGLAEILTVTNHEPLFATQDEFREVHSIGILVLFILEPCGRNTAATITIAALRVAEKHGPDARMLVLTTDQVVANHPVFEEAVQKASLLDATGKLVAFVLTVLSRPPARSGAFARILFRQAF